MGLAAVAAEREGYDGWWAFETQIDRFLGCAVAAERTETIDIGTSIVVAFARNPMTKRRYGDVATRIALTLPETRWRALFDLLRA